MQQYQRKEDGDQTSPPSKVVPSKNSGITFKTSRLWLKPAQAAEAVLCTVHTPSDAKHHSPSVYTAKFKTWLGSPDVYNSLLLLTPILQGWIISH